MASQGASTVRSEVFAEKGLEPGEGGFDLGCSRGGRAAGVSVSPKSSTSSGAPSTIWRTARTSARLDDS